MSSGPSVLRPEISYGGNNPMPSTGTALLLTYNAVRAQPALIHGRLHANGLHCALGSFWEINKKLSYPPALIDEVAAVNDSMPAASGLARKRMVLRWLRWKLRQMPGFEKCAKP
jgi:hypothetical protein